MTRYPRTLVGVGAWVVAVGVSVTVPPVAPAVLAASGVGATVVAVIAVVVEGLHHGQ